MNRLITLLYIGAAPLALHSAVSPELTDSSVVALGNVEVVGVKKLASNPAEPITVIDSAAIARQGVTAIKDVGILAPNIYMPDYGSRMTSSIYVRGLGARIDQPVVGLNVDNVPYLNKDCYDFDLADIGKIEVVRGSTGVLNGRNSLGGQINITTLSPWTVRGARFLAEYGKANTTRAAAAWYGLLSSKLASSVSGQFNHTDGFYRNTYNNSHAGTENAGSARWKLSWNPESRWSIMNVAAFNAGRQNGYPYASEVSDEIAYNDPTFYRRLNFTDGLTASYTGRRMIATSITSVQYLDDNMTLDQDFLPLDYFTMTQRRHEWTWTQDLYAKGIRKAYSWIGGAFAFVKSTQMNAPVTFGPTGITRLIEDNVNAILPPGMHLGMDSPDLLLDSRFRQRNAGFALYHQSEIKVGHFLFQAGLRWDIEHITLDYNSDCESSATMYRQLPGGQLVPLATRPLSVHDADRLKSTYSELLPQIAAGYAGNSFQASVRVAKGYKAGGYNTQMFSDILQQQLMESIGAPAAYDIESMLSYRPEHAWTYEVTAQTATTDKRFATQFTAFLMTIRNQQLTVFPEGQTTGRAMTNAGRTRSAGLEWTGQFTPVRQLELAWSYGYTHARFTRYNNGNTDLKGKTLPFAPAHTVFASATWTMPEIAGTHPQLNVNTHALGKIYWDDTNTASQPFYATLNASLTVPLDKVALTIWADNITNTHYNTFRFVSIGNAFVQKGRPITFGATVRININTK